MAKILSLNRDQVVVCRCNQIMLKELRPNSEWKKLATVTCSEDDMLSVSGDLSHFAYWNGCAESFYLHSMDGSKIWQKRINTDKAIPLEIKFSQSSDAVAFFDDYDGGYRIHFYSIEKSYDTDFGPSLVPIICDAELRRFGCVEPVPSSDPFIPPASKCDKNRITIRDRRGSIRDYIVINDDCL